MAGGPRINRVGLGGVHDAAREDDVQRPPQSHDARQALRATVDQGHAPAAPVLGGTSSGTPKRQGLDNTVARVYSGLVLWLHVEYGPVSHIDRVWVWPPGVVDRFSFTGSPGRGNLVSSLRELFTRVSSEETYVRRTVASPAGTVTRCVSFSLTHLSLSLSLSSLRALAARGPDSALSRRRAASLACRGIFPARFSRRPSRRAPRPTHLAIGGGHPSPSAPQEGIGR